MFIVQVDNVTNIGKKKKSISRIVMENLSLFDELLFNVYFLACEDPRVPCIRNGNDVLTRYDFSASNFWSDIIKIALIYIILHVCAYRLLLIKLRKRTN